MSGSSELPAPVALVTGATSGIGRAVARKLAADGFSVLVHGRDAARGAAVVDAIIADGGHARLVAADLTDAAEIERLAAEAADVDVLVNNAGFSWFGPTADLAPGTPRRAVRQPTSAARRYFLVAAFGPADGRARQPAAIVNLGEHGGAASAWRGGAACSAATKGALASLRPGRWAAEFSPQRRQGERCRAWLRPTPTARCPERITALGATSPAGPGRRGDCGDRRCRGRSSTASAGRATSPARCIAADGGRTAVSDHSSRPMVQTSAAQKGPAMNESTDAERADAATEPPAPGLRFRSESSERVRGSVARYEATDGAEGGELGGCP